MSRNRKYGAKGQGPKSKKSRYFAKKSSAEKYAAKTEAARFLKQFGFTLGQLHRASDDQLFETYRAYGGDIQLLESQARIKAAAGTDEEQIIMERWQKMAGLLRS